MTRIGIDARLTYYRVGGTSSYIRYLLDALERLDRDNTYTVFQSRKAREQLVPRLRHFPLWTPSHHRLERLALSVELLPHRLDVLHSPDFIPPLRGAKRHIITVHDLAFLLWPEHMTTESRHYYNDQIKMAVTHADHILAVSEATKRDLVSMLNVPESKITVQLHGVDPRFKPLLPELCETTRRKFDLPERYLLFVGTLEPRKNILGLLDAYNALRDCLPDAPPLVLVGKYGWLAEKIVEQVQNTANVIWIQNIEHDTLPAVMNGASALVLPAFYEGFGLPALEAMACGTIPVVSNRASLPEVVGDVGLLIDPDDPATLTAALHRVLTAPTEWLHAQRQAALERAATFTWERSAQIARSVYEKANN